MRDPATRLAFRTVVIAALASLAGLAASEERKGPPGAVFPSQLEEVHLTVSVRDATGRLVSTLKPEDFVVL